MLDAQAERLERMAAQASAAQLAMLRYQINPHFLFNTLNSISTLVLLAETERANTMLSRLSNFLRYSLTGEREGFSTLAQEVNALKLYLDIERTRFEHRLRASFDIDPQLSEVRIPAMLLQPLVENAVKYAVTPSEDGADILVSARRRGDRIELVVADTGPGLADRPASSPGTGLGLRNTRDRLAQAYGDAHRFELQPNLAADGSSPGVQPQPSRPGGLLVRIEIPFQTVEPGAAAPQAVARARAQAASAPPVEPGVIQEVP
jgi:LytS/YehU family sensor histidine kinase